MSNVSGGVLSYTVFGAATGVTLLAFLILRLLDDAADAPSDRNTHPHRPVPRGLVSPRELYGAAAGAACVQAALATAVHPAALLPLALVWACTALIRVGFALPAALRKRDAVVLVTHAVVVPAIVAAAASLSVVAAADAPMQALAQFAASDAARELVLLTYATSIVFEVGRKLLPGEDGGRSYAAAWGRPNATAVWVGAAAATWIFSVRALHLAGSSLVLHALTLMVVSACTLTVIQASAKRTGDPARSAEKASAALVFTVFSALSHLALP